MMLRYLSYLEKTGIDEQGIVREKGEDVNNIREEIIFNRLKTKFFANLSHEFKTPLNLIFSSIKMIELFLEKNSHAYNEGLTPYLKSIKKNSFRLLKLLSNLIDLTRIEADDFKLDLKECDIVKLMHKLGEEVYDQINRRGRSFRIKSQLGTRVIVCDPSIIERIILNLLSNALKFTKKGDQIIITISENDNFLIISVRDTGIGIEKDKQALIFQEFRQADETFSRINEGSGIGLSIVKSLVELHEGTIEVDSIPGSGSDFLIKLPIDLEKNHANRSGAYQIENLIDKVDVEFSDIIS
ncbi:HAMP domain-containing sensor histidine kinase [Halocella sp. SP3-1]|uniref:sensor histidine kinase n=1 Tax=Halocella sp. SP3-1 TaxID=2382161 RepID=UPI000F759CCD|nr:HAMP domain-containing sensor histidine kinase [Halocella sp. SP3-1]AZO94783.1 sensor histidine kinase [Halocella sp. SP3-1]